MTKETSMSPTPLEIAAALRSAADFCRDPNSPKCHGYAAKDSAGNSVDPTDHAAVRWCAIGWGIRTLGEPFPRAATATDGRYVSPAFDRQDYETAAQACEAEAVLIEASLPVADHAPTRETSNV